VPENGNVSVLGIQCFTFSFFSFSLLVIIPLWNLFNPFCTLITDSADTLEKVFVSKTLSTLSLYQEDGENMDYRAWDGFFLTLPE